MRRSDGAPLAAVYFNLKGKAMSKMTQPKHTPGPWSYEGGMIKGPGTTIVDLHGAMGGDDTEADARLIAAAPDLLATLSAWTDWAVNRDVPFLLIQATRAAIFKANGR